MIKLIADKITISGPTVDGTITLKLSCGEYERDNVLEAMKLPTGTYKITIESEQTE